MAQQSTDCQQSKTQKAAAFFNRVRNPTAPAATPACPAAATDVANGNVIGTGKLDAPFLERGRPEVPHGGYVTFTGSGGTNQVVWQWTGDKNRQIPNVWLSGTKASGPGQDGGYVEGKIGSTYYLTLGKYHAAITQTGSTVTLAFIGDFPKTGMVNLDGTPINIGVEPLKSTYALTPFPPQIEEALHKLGPEAGLGVNQRGGTLIVVTGDNRAQISVVQNPGDPRNVWINHGDPSKAYMVDGDSGASLIRQNDGSWMSEDGKKLVNVNGVGVLR
jgi:hypothetical protein